VLQPQDGNVLEYEPSGKFLRTIGRRGDGPGEFSFPNAIGLRDSSLWIADGQSQRLTIISPNTRAQTIAIPTIQVLPGRQPVILALAGASSAFYVSYPYADRYGGAAFTQSAFGIAGRNGAQEIGTVYTGHYVGLLKDERDAKSQRMSFIQPIDDSDILIPTSHGIAVIDRRVPTSAYGSIGITMYDSSGKKIRNTKVPISARAVTTTERNAYINLMVDAALKGKIVKTKRQASMLLSRQMFLPKYYPPVYAAALTSEGKLWVQRDRGVGKADYMIISASGKIVAQASGPSDTKLIAANSQHIWVQGSDSLNLPYIVRLRIAANPARR
jgi:hypothetical protein